MLIPLIVATLISFLVTPFVISFSWKLGLIDDPSKYSHPKVLHTHPIPRGGGLAIFISIFISTILFLKPDIHIIAILFGSLIILVMGLLDDKYNLNPYLRLIVQFIAASIPVLSGISVTFITNPVGGVINLPVWIAVPAAILWIGLLRH